MSEYTESHSDLPLFDGNTYIPIFDAERLTGQWKRVWGIMSDGEWRTLSELQGAIMSRHAKYDSEAALSARLRDLRKDKWGAHTVDRRRRGEASKGLFEYRVEI